MLLVPLPQNIGSEMVVVTMRADKHIPAERTLRSSNLST